jgi:serine protease Do
MQERQSAAVCNAAERQSNSQQSNPYHLRFQRAKLISVAALGAAVLLAAPSGVFAPLIGSAPIYAAETEAPRDFADLVAKVKPAVISVQVKLKDTSSQALGKKFFNPFGEHGKRRVIIGEGSGFFITAAGYAVTNNHVVDDAKTVRVTTDDGTIYTAKVVGTDPKTDLAVIKVDASKEFPHVQFTEHPPRVGQWVIAVGNPFGLGGTVTAGIVSARGRNIGGSPYDDYLQIDAPINRGNSGGPTFDMNGNVVGVNTAIFSPSGGSVGIGFDIPADTAKMVVDQLMEKGYVTRGWMGVEVQPVTPEIAEGLGMKKAGGALVDEPQPGSPADKAGIKAGDVITELNGEPIKDARALAQKIAGDKPGGSVQLTIVREGKSKKLELTLAEMPRQKQAKASPPQQPQERSVEPNLGLSLAPANEVAGAGDKGVVVLGVNPDSPAAASGMQDGFIILNINGKAVDNPAQVHDAVTQSRSQGRHAVLMRVQTPEGTRFVAVPFGQG